MTTGALPSIVVTRLASLLRFGIPYRTAIEIGWTPKVDSDGKIPLSYLPDNLTGGTGGSGTGAIIIDGGSATGTYQASVDGGTATT